MSFEYLNDPSLERSIADLIKKGVVRFYDIENETSISPPRVIDLDQYYDVLAIARGKFETAQIVSYRGIRKLGEIPAILNEDLRFGELRLSTPVRSLTPVI